jgi:hypothetical protein
MSNPMGLNPERSKPTNLAMGTLESMSLSNTEAGMHQDTSDPTRFSTVTRSRALTKVGDALVRNLAPAHLAEGATADLYQVVTDGNQDSFSCYLWKKSQFYSKIPNHPKAWQLRWCTVDGQGFRSARTRGLKQGTKAMDIFNTFAVRARADRQGERERVRFAGVFFFFRSRQGSLV